MLDLDQDPLRGLSDALLGQVLPGSEGRRYPLRERIGEGGQGWVFRATWNGSIDVVVKVLRPDAANAESLARFQREARVLQMLSQQASPNPHVVRFFDHAYARVHVAATGKSWDLPFTVLELVEGETLEQAITRAQPGGIGLERTRRILRHIVLALKDVHANNIVHRDLKPSNVLLTTSGPREIAKVTDFGLAKLLDPGMQRTTHLAGATVGYAPPEQFENGNLRVGRQTDVFSLAAIFYELVTGLPAFPFPPDAHPLMVIVNILNEKRPAFERVSQKLPRELQERPDVVAAVDAELARALAPEPSDRHPTVVDFQEAIERVLTALATSPSLPLSRHGAGVVVRPSQRPETEEDMGMAATMEVAAAAQTRIGGTAPMLPVVGGAALSSAPALQWRRITDTLLPGAYRSIAVGASGGRAIGLGPRGPALWKKGRWSSFEVPEGIDPDSLRAAAWVGERVVLAGMDARVVLVDDHAPPTVWRLGAPGIVFHAAYADDEEIVLAGEQATSRGPQGMIATIPLAARTGPAWRLFDVPGSGTLRAAARLGKSALACGDAGVLVRADVSDEPRVVNACEPALHALVVTADGAVAAVGGGGFAFRVSPSLRVQLEAVQTHRDLFALALGPDGVAWCGGAGGRVLRREPSGWVRVGDTGTEARVCALHVSGHRVLVFCEDGAVIEGAVR